MEKKRRTLIGLLLGCLLTATTYAQPETEDLQKQIQETVSAAMELANKQIQMAMEQANKELEAAQKELEESKGEIERETEEENSEELRKALEEKERAIKQAEETIKKTEEMLKKKFGDSNDTGDEESSTKLKIGNSKIIITKDEDTDSTKQKNKNICVGCDERNKHWAGLELGVAGYVTPSNSLNVSPAHNFLELDYSRSINFNINFWEKDIRIVKDYFKFSTGLGFDFTSYTFRSNFTLVPNVDMVIADTESNINYQKNKLKTSWITVPMLFGFSSHLDRDKAFRFSVGAVGAVKLGSKTKQQYEEEGQKHKSKVKSHYNLLPYRYGARASVGYGNFNVYVNYALSYLFEKAAGPALQPITAGIRILLF